MNGKWNLFSLGISVGCLLLGAHVSSAQEDQPVQKTEKQLIADAYNATLNAATVQDFTSVIDRCAAAGAIELSAANAAYIRQLSGWAYNKRGEGYADQAEKLMRENKTQDAEKYFAQALADFELAVQNDPKLYKAAHNRGVSYAMAGDYEAAVADFTKVLELKPDYANAHFNRGESYYQLGEFNKAIADYNRVLALNPRDFAAYISRGHAHYQLKQYRQAVTDYSQAVQINPRSAVAVVNRADAYQSLQQWGAAANDYRRAMQLNNKYARAFQGAAWLMATCPDESIRSAEKALTAAQQAIEFAGEDYRGLDTLAAAQANAGQYEAAVATITKAIESAPEEEIEGMAKRLSLYEGKKPYRQ